MKWIGIDLGSTNIKIGLYDEALCCVRMESVPVVYMRENGHVEFDAEAYAESLKHVLRSLSAGETDISAIGFTGQAESLVVLDREGKPMMPAISWMDERSIEECAAVEARFPGKECYLHTGQPAALPTWPATKILWLKKHMPEVFRDAAHYVLLKDYIVYALTGNLVADSSIATFTFYFDIYKKCYWQEMLRFLDVSEAQLPPLVEPCTFAGTLLPDVAQELGLSSETRVNIGTLDHFAGMIGTGNTAPGTMSLSTGTVMGLSITAATPVRKDTGIPMHYGFLPDTYIMLPVAESGGVSLEWFKRACMKGVSYDELNAVLKDREISDIVFLPFLVGTNAPEFDREACGLFYGLRSGHDCFDMALAVMEGVAHLLKRNCDFIQSAGTKIDRIIATGGGAKSAIWCQMQADITGIPVEIPAEPEAACLGAAMLAAVQSGAFATYEDAAAKAVRMEKRFLPKQNPRYERKHAQYLKLYEAMLSIKTLQ